MLLTGRYRLAEVIGRGATATVWRARDEVLHRDVAIKRFHERRSQGLREARIAARIQHPNVVTVYDVLPSGDLVMEYRGGPTLATLLAVAAPFRRPSSQRSASSCSRRCRPCTRPGSCTAM